tara:strand:- start:253 stop:948 length:696 start_codon:yes stop_codon:yes gene_type:complete
MNLLVIPARGGSKRIPKKNIKHFKGKPIIEWVVKEAINSNLFDRVIVSTDSKEIAKVSLNVGAEVPFLRPNKLADDYTSTSEVIIHTIDWFKQKGIFFSTVSCLYPTAIFIKRKDLKNALEQLNKSEKGIFIFSATAYNSSIQRAFYIDNQGYTKMFNPEFFKTRTQDLKYAYHDAGQFYMAACDTWLQKSDILNNSKAYIIPKWGAQDIDNNEDWEMAEFIFDSLSKKKN